MASVKTKNLRRLLVLLTIGALAAIIVIPLNPVSSRSLRLATLAALFGVWLGPLLLTWNYKPIRFALFVLAALLPIPFLLPGRSIDQTELRTAYLSRMQELEGTKYFWGGESRRGIDCSGLPRRALRGALLSYGIRHADGGAIRLFAEQWWHDASAQALGDGYRNYTMGLETTGTIAEMPYSELVPGDLAVTTNGRHILAYLGDEKWIQADPGLAKVATLHGRNDENGWFKIPVTTHRWRVLHEH